MIITQRPNAVRMLIATLLVIVLSANANAESQLYFVHTDHLGTPQVVTDKNQNVVWKGEYTPFGEVKEVVNTLGQNVRFPGQYFDAETGLHYNYFRDYDPTTGRYVQSDPIGLRGGVNTYAYVSGNPLSFVDPLGLIQFKPGTNTNNVNPKIKNNYPKIDKAVSENSRHKEAVVTSGNDGKHKKDSKHYCDNAIDIRGNNVTDEQMNKIAEALKESLDDDFDVIPEFFPASPANDHIHIEYDP